LATRLSGLRLPHRLLLESERLLLGPHLLLKGKLLQHDLLCAPPAPPHDESEPD
jgi:hypothetical protein